MKCRLHRLRPLGGSSLCRSFAVLLLLRDGGKGFCQFVGSPFGSLFGFQDKRLLPVQINAPSAEPAVAVVEVQRLFKDVVVLRFIGLGGFRFWYFQQLAEFFQERLAVRHFCPAASLPTGDEFCVVHVGFGALRLSCGRCRRQQAPQGMDLAPCVQSISRAALRSRFVDGFRTSRKGSNESRPIRSLGRQLTAEFRNQCSLNSDPVFTQS